jgi:hypothetical protein
MSPEEGEGGGGEMAPHMREMGMVEFVGPWVMWWKDG